MAIDWDAHVISPSVKVFGEPITYRPASGAPYPINGVFDNNYRPIDELVGDLMPAISAIPVVGVRVLDFRAPPVQGDQLTILGSGITYMVKEHLPDSHGHVLLKLNRVSA